MDKATRAMLNDAEQALLREVEPKRLDRLDEDGLADLHDRIRRARTKYTKLYRRRAAAQVEAKGRRAGASDAHARNRAKAEAFEEALATVSQRLASAARASARELRDERLAAGPGQRPEGHGDEGRRPEEGLGQEGLRGALVADPGHGRRRQGEAAHAGPQACGGLEPGGHPPVPGPARRPLSGRATTGSPVPWWVWSTSLSSPIALRSRWMPAASSGAAAGGCSGPSCSAPATCP